MRKLRFWIPFGLVLATLAFAQSSETARTRLADGFDIPVGKPNGDGYYKARGFRPNGHLGEDWNGIKGGNSDLGDPVYSTAHGLVVFARDVRLGWGNVVVIRHIFLERGKLVTVDSLYGHLDRILVKEGKQVLRGQLVGTIGTGHGRYPAHLHFEIHKNIEMGVSRNGFRHDFTNYYDPTDFINKHRALPGGGRTALVAINTFTDSRTFGPPSNGGAPVKRQPLASGSSSASRPTPTPKIRSNTFRVDRFGNLDSL